MPLSERIQWFIHKLEMGAGSRYLRLVALVLGVVALALVYDLRAYRNLAAPEAMDAAQLARNLSEGRGYTTLWIRPFSLYLVQQHNEALSPFSLTNATADSALIKTAHPDLANPPAYPLLLAGLMKVLPFQYEVDLKRAFWMNGGSFWRYEPDFLIALFNQLLLVVVLVLTFSLAKRLFDANVAWLSAILVLSCELLWHFSTSGLSTMLLLVIFMGLTRLLLEIERGARETQISAGGLFGLAIAAGFLTGIGALTRYAFGWTIIPVALFLILFSGPKGRWLSLTALVTFTLVLTPWIMRNEMVSGTAFGTAGYSLVEGTYVFPQFQLERSLHPDLTQAVLLRPYSQKLAVNARALLSGNLLQSGATWPAVLFFAGLLLGFRSNGARRMRYFLLLCLAFFIVVQSLGRTQLSEFTPEINSENLLVLLVPLVFIFGSSFFFTLLDQMTLPLPQLRYAVIAGFVGLCSLPLIFAVGSSSPPVVYPPYYPPDIQQTAKWMKPSELMMSDIPWAVAWYGDRQCLWLTQDSQDAFFAVNDYLKPVQALYLTSETMDGKLFSEWGPSAKNSWGHFMLFILSQNKPPQSFPLVAAAPGIQSGMFLTDRARWKTGPQP